MGELMKQRAAIETKVAAIEALWIEASEALELLAA